MTSKAVNQKTHGQHGLGSRRHEAIVAEACGTKLMFRPCSTEPMLVAQGPSSRHPPGRLLLMMGRRRYYLPCHPTPLLP